MNTALWFFVVALGLPLLTFAFGWGVLGKLTDLDDEERFAAAWGVGFAFLGLAEFLAFMRHASQGLFNLRAMALMGVIVLFCQFGKRRTQPFTPDFWRLAGFWALGVAHLMAVQALLPLYVGADWWGDWRMHYQAAQVFLGSRSDDWAFMDQYTMASRTPLFNQVAAFGLSLSGEHFWVFQVLASWMNWCFPLALYLVVRDVCGARVGRFALLLAPLNLWMLHLAWFTWPKLLTAYFLLLGLHFYLTSLRRRRTDVSGARSRFLLFGVSSLFGIMTHSVGVVYFAPLFLHAAVTAWRARGAWLRLRDFAALGLASALVLGPWHGWLLWRFGSEEISKASPATIMRAEVAQGSSNVALAWLGAMGQNLATSVLPAADLTTRSASSIPESLYLYATGVYFNSLTGALTLALTAFLVIHVIRRHMRGAQPSNRPLPCEATERCAFWLFVILGCLGAVALHPRPSVHGLAHNAFFTSAVLLVGLAWTTLARAPRRWIHVVGAGMMLEFLAMFWSHVWFTAAPNFLDCTGYNASAKQEESYVFLRDFLGGYYPLAVATAIGIQLALAVLLVRAARRLPIVERETPPLQAAQTDNA